MAENEQVTRNPYTRVETLILDANEEGRQIARIEGAIWPPIGSVIELYDPNRDATVVAVRLSLAPDYSAAIFVDVEDPGEQGTTYPRVPGRA